MIARRKLMQVLGQVFGAAALMPLAELTKATASPIPAVLRAMAADMQKTADAFRAGEAPELLAGTYDRIFQHRPSERSIEQTVHVAYFADPDHSGQRFLYQSELAEYGLGFLVVRDDDPRKTIGGVPVARLADLPQMLRSLAISFQSMREIHAAELFDNADVYDAHTVGDGVAMCSPMHPCDGATWANALATPCDLNGHSLRHVLEQIRTTFVDQRGLRISARGRRLVVPLAIAYDAERAIAQLKADDPFNTFRFDYEPVVWDYLTKEHRWFVLTTCQGFHCFEREPFSVACDVDVNKDCVHVIGHEKRAFACHDPRAVFMSAAA